MFRHTHLHKGSESGCFAEIDPRIDLRIVGQLLSVNVNGGMLDNSP